MLKPPGNKSCSDRFPLPATKKNTTYSFQKMEVDNPEKKVKPMTTHFWAKKAMFNLQPKGKSRAPSFQPSPQVLSRAVSARNSPRPGAASLRAPGMRAPPQSAPGSCECAREVGWIYNHYLNKQHRRRKFRIVPNGCGNVALEQVVSNPRLIHCKPCNCCGTFNGFYEIR